ncbi:NHL repeat-containing protein [bacterium]|nr:NHL repeat-containing protein [bacterium]
MCNHCLPNPNNAFADPLYAPDIKYKATVEDFEGRKIELPAGICFDFYGEMYILDGGSRTVLTFSKSLLPSARISKEHGLFTPSHTAVNRDGEIYIVESSEKGKASFVSVFNLNLKKIKTITFKGFKGAEGFVPNAIEIDKDKRIYLAGYTRPGIVVLEADGNFIAEISPEDTFGLNEAAPVIIRDIAIDNDGKIFLLSEEMGSVYVYSKEHDLLFKFGKKGGVAGALSRPRGIAIDQRGYIYITDYMRHCVNIYDSDGTYLTEFGGKGTGHGWFNYPQSIAISRDNLMAVMDFLNKRVELFQIYYKNL